MTETRYQLDELVLDSRRDQFIPNVQNPMSTRMTQPHLFRLKGRFSWGCILFQLMVCHFISTATAFMHPSHKFRNVLWYPKQPIQQPTQSTMLMAIQPQQQQLRFTRNHGNHHRLIDTEEIIKYPSPRIKYSRTQLDATSVPSPQQNLNQQQQQRHDEQINRQQSTAKREWKTLLRVGVPSIVAGVISYLIFPFLAMTLASSISSAGALTVLSTDSSQFVQNFLSVSSLLFSILVGQTCT